jgi:dehydrogenase/reductase SDR family protein 4
MAQEGGKVLICSRKQENVDTAVAAIKKAIEAEGSRGTIEGMAVNVGSKEHRAKLVQLIKEKYGKLDVLVPNVASSTHLGDQMAISERAYDKMWDINTKSTFFLIAETIDLLRLAGSGANICIISSVTGTLPNKMIGVYGSTKAALENMIKWMKDEFRSDGIRVNGIAPGLIKTEFSGPLW